MTTTDIVPSRCHALSTLELFQLWHRNYLTRKTLRGLSIQQLADVGLSADQASAEGKKWFWQ
jgi:uncharacterized protein YjiS (DUF1127 family)